MKLNALLQPKQSGHLSTNHFLRNEIKTMKPLRVKDTKSIRNFVTAVRGFILGMEDVGASDQAKSRYVFADILA